MSISPPVRQSTEYINLAALGAGEYRAAIARAAGMLRVGRLVAFPTETVYGLGANGLDAAACRAIYAAKGRPADNPLTLHVADRAGLERVVAKITPSAEKIIAAFMPGPVTIVLPRAACVPDAATGGLATVGVRMPDNAVARDLISAAGVPLAAPSANLSGRPSPTDAAAVRADLDGRIAAILDGGTTSIGLESTIIDCTGRWAAEGNYAPDGAGSAKSAESGEKKSRPAVAILRWGAITAEMLAAIGIDAIAAPLEKSAVGIGANAASLEKKTAGGENTLAKASAPGRKYAHYAPRAPLTLCRSIASLRAEYARRTAAGEKVGLIVSDETAALLARDETAAPLSDDAYIFRLAPRADTAAMAARLYPALRYFDNLPATSLLAETFSEEGLGRAVMNRLREAAGGRII